MHPFKSCAPTDNTGLGRTFSPTDTVATGSASCMWTMMGIKAEGLDIDLRNTKVEVTKDMGALQDVSRNRGKDKFTVCNFG